MTEKEILIDAFKFALGYLSKDAPFRGICTIVERYLNEAGDRLRMVHRYIDSNAPDSAEWFPYKWEPGLMEPRVKWIKEQLKKLENE